MVWMDDGLSQKHDPALEGLTAFFKRGLDGVDEPRICHALRQASPTRTSRADKARRDIPWLTLVLGSECLEIQANGFNPGGLPDAVEDQHNREFQTKRGPLAKGVAGFIKALVEDRLGPDLPSAQNGKCRTFARWELLLFESVALLNETYFRAKFEQKRSVSQWGDGTVSLLSGGGGSLNHKPSTGLDELARDLKLSLKKLESATQEVERRPLQDLVTRIVGAWSSDEVPVSIADVQAITEVTWQCLIQENGVYPGWPELLVYMSLSSNARSIRQGHPRPSFARPREAAPVIRELLNGVTEATAELYARDDTLPPRMRAYRQYAEVLATQAKLRSAVRPPLRPPPPAVAYVTTFDVELEMAMRHNYPDRPFVVAMPANVIERREEGKNSRATSLWLGYIVRPSARDLVDAVTKPGDDDWFVLSGRDIDLPRGSQKNGLPSALYPDGVGFLGEMPFIVKLAGSPLVDLPGINDWEESRSPFASQVVRVANPKEQLDAPAAGRSTEDHLEPQFYLSHALLLEEHHSLRYSLPEVVKESGRGLPLSLSCNVMNGHWRYWTLLGVQMSDPIIRYRLISQMISAGLLQEASPGYRRPNHSGVAINRNHLSARASDLLLWSDFDLVKADCETLTPELEHYVRHLTQIGGITLPETTARCELP